MGGTLFAHSGSLVQLGEHSAHNRAIPGSSPGRSIDKKIPRIEGGEVAGYENIKDKGFDHRSTDEVREIASRGGQKSGETRRRKAMLRDTMNKLLTMKVDVPGLSEVLKADGNESTYEEVVVMAMIEKAALGNVPAYRAIMETVGQTTKSDGDIEEQNARIALMRAKSQTGSGEDIADDGFLEALKGTAAEDWADEED